MKFNEIEWCYQDRFLQCGVHANQPHFAEPHWHVSFECTDGITHMVNFQTRHEAHLLEVDLRSNGFRFDEEYGIQIMWVKGL